MNRELELLLDDVEFVLGNLILEIGLEDGCDEYKVWERLKEYIDRHDKVKGGSK